MSTIITLTKPEALKALDNGWHIDLPGIQVEAIEALVGICKALHDRNKRTLTVLYY